MGSIVNLADDFSRVDGIYRYVYIKIYFPS